MDALGNGIDAVAHSSSLNTKVKTIAILGTSISDTYSSNASPLH
jgi:predicted Rossmann fold nucleotide-binding protein DprA/Smf involved in DNA uptake